MLDLRRSGLVEQRRNADGLRLTGRQQFLEIGQRGAAVEDVLHQQQVVILNRALEVEDDPHRPEETVDEP